MKVLLVLQGFGHMRHFQGVAAELVARGHIIKVLGPEQGQSKGDRLTRGARPDFETGSRAPPRTDRWAIHADALRAFRNYLLFLRPGRNGAKPFRDRAAAFVAPELTRLASARSPSGVAWLERCCAAVNAVIPTDPAVVDQLRREAPQVVLVSPLVGRVMALHEYVAAANDLGIPVGLPVFSWDNLATKGTAHDHLDRVFVWNEAQRREGGELHDWPSATIEALGAWPFDEFRRLSPMEDRGSFCARYGFDPDRPIITFLGSSQAIAPNEAEIAAEWLDAIRGCPSPAVSGANVLFRPHPRNPGAWSDAQVIAGAPRCAVQSRDELSLKRANGLYDVLHHSKAVVSLVTSAVLEAALLGKPVHSLAAGLSASAQDRAPHFHHLLGEGGGLVHRATSFEDHVRRLDQHLGEASDGADARARGFARAFLDPPVPGASATVALADAIERLAKLQKAPRRRPWWTPLARPLVAAALKRVFSSYPGAVLLVPADP